MQQSLEKKIKALLKNNLSKRAIYKMLVTDANKNELTNLLNNLPINSRRKITFGITLFIAGLLSLLTIKQGLYVYLHSNSAASLILGFVVPIIHIYIIRELMRSHRLAYQLLPFLSILALFRQENRILPDMYMYICMAILSGILYLFLFPKKEQLQYSQV